MGRIAIRITQIQAILENDTDGRAPQEVFALQNEKSHLEHIQGLWDQLGYMPMDPETECLEEQFLDFPIGTHREDIWHWFEETFDICVAEDLMYQGQYPEYPEPKKGCTVP